MDIKEILERAKTKKKENKKFLNKLKKNPPKNLDEQIHQLHDEVFTEINCLNCANCCKTTGPLFTKRDINRIAKHLGMKEAEFEAEYLKVDEEGDYVLQRTPCRFLGEDNYCSIYDVRPKACAAYPHTDHIGFHKILDLTLKNTLMCPAAFEVIERFKKDY